MSKSRGNTVSPDKFIEMYGSDTFRAYLMFMGPAKPQLVPILRLYQFSLIER